MYPEGPERDKIYFSENQVPNLIKQRKKHLPQAIKSYKLAVMKNSIYKKDKLFLEIEAKVGNEAVNKILAQA